MKIRLFHGEESFDLTVSAAGAAREVVVEGADSRKRLEIEVVAEAPPLAALRIDGRAVRCLVERRGSLVRVALLGECFEFDLADSTTSRRGGHAAASPETRSPMPGKVLQVTATVGAAVKPGDSLLILEAMKMENVLVAEIAGVVAEVHVAAGDMVEPGQLLVVVRPEQPS